MSNIYFLRTVPEIVDQSGDIERKLEITVRNTGNYFFEHAVARHLKGFKTVAKMQELPDTDCTLVLSMSNFISPYTDLGEVADQIEKKKVERVVMIGAGAQADDFSEKISLTRGTRRFLEILSERSASIGVRGVYTAEVLNQLRIRNVDIIGCPSVFYHGDPAFAVKSGAHTDANLRSVFHCTPTGFYRDNIARLISFGIANCESYVAQSERDFFGLHSESEQDQAATEFFFNYYNDGSIEPEQASEWFRRNVRWFFNLQSWLEYMKTVDFAFGARFHGNMAAILMGVPALNMVFDTRTRELCEYLNLPYMHLSDFRADMKLGDLYRAADFSLFNRTYPVKYRAYRDFLVKNGLSVVLPEAPPLELLGATCQARAARQIVDDLLHTGSLHGRLDKELSLRIAPFRDAAQRLSAEAGNFERAVPPGRETNGS